jgi:hypothetical protein
MKNKSIKIKKLGIDKVFGFVIIKIVNPTAFPRFGGRRQFFIYE